MLRRLIERLSRRRLPTDVEIDRELRDHLELEAESIATTDRATQSAARDAARRRFGNVSRVRESVREIWRWVWLEQLAQDTRHGLRAIARSPVYSLAVIVTLALGIGAGTTVYTLARAIHTPFPQLSHDKLLWITYGNARCGTSCTELSPAAFVALQRRAVSMAAIATSNWSTSLRGTDGSEAAKGFAVSPATWDLIGARFAAGHGFPKDAGAEGGPRVVVISYDFWHRRLNASPGVIDSVITLGGQPYSVAGVLAKDVVFPMAGDVYVPFRPTSAEGNDHASRYLDAFARLADGAAIDKAAVEVKTINAQLAQESPKTDSGWVLRARPIADYHTDDVAILDNIAGSAALLVFLAACMSAANLALARLSGRRHELALRAALGVRRSRLARHLLTEAALLSPPPRSVRHSRGGAYTRCGTRFPPTSRRPCQDGREWGSTRTCCSSRWELRRSRCSRLRCSRSPVRRASTCRECWPRAAAPARAGCTAPGRERR
jgi:hypothetical protein